MKNLFKRLTRTSAQRVTFSLVSVNLVGYTAIYITTPELRLVLLVAAGVTIALVILVALWANWVAEGEPR